MASESNRSLTAVDLFCGSGAVTMGLKHSGFKVVSAVDIDPVAAETYRLNHPKIKHFEEDIRHFNPELIRSEFLGGKALDLLVVCAPCQPFSSQNKKKGNDERAALILNALPFAETLQPRLIFFENVPGLKASRNSRILAELKSGFRLLKYSLCDPITIDAADYGVPQRRNRCIMFAFKQFRPEIPMPITPAGQRKTVEAAFQGLPSLSSGEQSKTDRLHFARRHRPIALKRMKFIAKNGGSRFSLPDELVLECHRNHRGHPDVYGRMKLEDVAPTLTTGCTDITRGRFMHPLDDRAITLREAARLQTFPDDYLFAGTNKAIATQIGNAVPIELARQIGYAMRQALSTDRR